MGHGYGYFTLTRVLAGNNCSERLVRSFRIGFSYVRLLLDDTALNAHQFRIGLADTRLCQCGQDIEDVHHYLLTCVKYESIRRDLLKCVDEVCSDDAHCSSLSLSASLFLSPWLHNMTDSECSEILAATFQFIYESARHP